jgi:hypothetical protein
MRPEEVDIGYSIFGESIDFMRVRIVEFSPVAIAFGARAIVQGYVIHFKSSVTFDVLVHELVHVWQYTQDGARYAPEAISSQNGGKGYEYANVPGINYERLDATAFEARVATLRERLNRELPNLGPFTPEHVLHTFNREQQGQIVRHYYLLRESIVNPNPPADTRRTNLAPILAIPLAIRKSYLTLYAQYVDEVSSFAWGRLALAGITATPPVFPTEITQG